VFVQFTIQDLQDSRQKPSKKGEESGKTTGEARVF
jgi:hypothetical protein